MENRSEIAVFGGGCFWCTEAVFGVLKGVTSTTSGYAGGESLNPTYESVSSGKTGHAEVLKIEFNPEGISYRDLLTVFFASHDPIIRNRQGADVGTQYRSIILYSTLDQKSEAEKYIQEIDTTDKPIATEVKKLDMFYQAETYHQNYYEGHQDLAYARAVIKPKLEKVEQEFKELLKTHL